MQITEKVFEDFFTKKFSFNCAVNQCDTIHQISNILMGTKKTRLGAKPTAECQSAICNVIQKKVKRSLPVPIVIAWGSEKPQGTALPDIAEIGALKVLQSLHEHLSPV